MAFTLNEEQQKVAASLFAKKAYIDRQNIATMDTDTIKVAIQAADGWITDNLINLIGAIKGAIPSISDSDAKGIAIATVSEIANYL